MNEINITTEELQNICNIINSDDRFWAEPDDDHYLIRLFARMLPERYPNWHDDMYERVQPLVLMYDLGVTWEPARAYPTPQFIDVTPIWGDKTKVAEALKRLMILWHYGDIKSQREKNDPEPMYQHIVNELINTKQKLGTIDKVFAYENGELTEDEVVELFQELVDSKMAWKLQGHYGRTATAMIDRGLIKPSNGKYT